MKALHLQRLVLEASAHPQRAYDVYTQRLDQFHSAVKVAKGGCPYLVWSVFATTDVPPAGFAPAYPDFQSVAFTRLA